MDRALRARFRDAALKRSVVLWLVGGMPHGALQDAIDEAAAEFEPSAAGHRASWRGASCCAVGSRTSTSGTDRAPFDKTELLLRGQELAEVAAVRDSGTVTFAAPVRIGLGLPQAVSASTGGCPPG